MNLSEYRFENKNKYNKMSTLAAQHNRVRSKSTKRNCMFCKTKSHSKYVIMPTEYTHAHTYTYLYVYVCIYFQAIHVVFLVNCHASTGYVLVPFSLQSSSHTGAWK